MYSTRKDRPVVRGSQIVADHSIGQSSQVRTGGGWSSGSCVYCSGEMHNITTFKSQPDKQELHVKSYTLTSWSCLTPSRSSNADPGGSESTSSESVARVTGVHSVREERSAVSGSSTVHNHPIGQ